MEKHQVRCFGAKLYNTLEKSAMRLFYKHVIEDK